jgi:hypothetical protein
MPSTHGNTHRDFWLKQCKRVSRRVNTAWWLESLSAPLLILSLAGAAALLWIRREIPVPDPRLLVLAIAAAVILLALVCLAIASRKFEQPNQSLVRIEASMRMRNALSSANEGITPWPEPQQNIDAGLGWHWRRLLVPLLGALALLAAGLWLPVSKIQTTASTTPEQPQSWQQLTEELDFLREEEVIDEPYLDETQKRLEQLKSQEEEQWFSHSSLEATDSLRTAHRAESERVEHDLESAANSLASLEQNAGAVGSDEKNRLMEEFDQALQALQNGAMKPNPELLEQMQRIKPGDLAKLSPEQLQQLRETLKKNAEQLKKCRGDGEPMDDGLFATDEEGEQPGRGGVNRGPGHDPGVLGSEKEGLETGEMAGLQAEDLSRSAPGDLLELQDGEHDVDRAASTAQTGGATDATGKGGVGVWRDALDPNEQRVLKRFFE